MYPLNLQLDHPKLSLPEPMQRILTSPDTLAGDDSIVARIGRRPIFPFPELGERGYTYACDPGDGDGFLLTIKKPQ